MTDDARALLTAGDGIGGYMSDGLTLLAPCDVAAHFGCTEREAIDRMREMPGRVLLSKRTIRLRSEALPGCPILPRPSISRRREREPRPKLPDDPESKLRRRMIRLVRSRRLDAPILGDHESTYFVHAPSAGLVKIGRSIRMGNRFANLVAGSPVPIVLTAQVSGCDVEELLHEYFAMHRRHNEWFLEEPVLVFLREAGLING